MFFLSWHTIAGGVIIYPLMGLHPDNLLSRPAPFKLKPVPRILPGKVNITGCDKDAAKNERTAS